MLNIKVLLTQLLNTINISVVTGTPTITTTKGTLVSSAYVKYGHIVQLELTIKNGSSISTGSDVYTGTITDTSLKPSGTTLICGQGYYGARALISQIHPDGSIIIRNAGASALSANSTASIVQVYLV